jgi:PAS domain S-box-containing protein
MDVSASHDGFLPKMSLEQAVQRYSDLYDLAPIGYVSFDRSGRIEECNLAAAKLFGISRERLIGMPFMIFVLREDTPVFLDHLLRCRCSDTQIETELRLKNIKRKVIWAYLYSSAVVDSGRKGALLYQTAIVDVTPHHRAEEERSEALREQSALYELSQRHQEAKSLEETYESALDVILRALRCDRAAILLYDSHQVMRFVASRGLSRAYRKAVEGHSPWKPYTKKPESICIPDLEVSTLPRPLKSTIRTQGIRAAAFIPLVSGNTLIGKFMAYYNAPHAFTGNETLLATTIGRQLAQSIQHKRDESALRQQEAELESIVAQTPFMLTRCTRDMRYRYVSRAYAELVGRSPNEIAGKRVVEVIGKEGLKTILPHVRKALKGETAEYEMEVPFIGIGVRLLHAVYTPDCDANGNVNGWFASILDITERKRTEKRLAEQARLLDLSNDAILVRDQNNRITYWNHGARELYGYSSEEALGKVTHELLKTEYPESLEEIQKKLEHDDRWRGEVVHTCKDGTKVVVMGRWALDRDAQGRPACVLETNTEISDRKREEARMAVNLAITRILSESPALIDAVPRILQAVCRTLGWDMGFFWATMADGKPLRCLNVWRSHAGQFSKFEALSRTLTYAQGRGLPGRAWRRLEPIWVRDLPKLKNSPRAKVASQEGIHGAFAFPIFFGTDFVGVMEFLSTEIRERDENVRRMFVSIGGQIAQFVQRKHTEEALQRAKEQLEFRVRARTSELHQANKELESEIQRRKGLEGEILSVSDREQQRLGQELHDGLCQHLTAVAFMTRSIALRLKDHRVVDAADIEKVAELVNQAAVDTRNLSRALHRVDVDAAGLVPALQDLVDREIWRTPCRLEVTPSFQINDDGVAAHLYRIAREAVINANKHAQARKILVRLERFRKEMVLRVIDDGVGFPKDLQPQHGLGYHIMNYRAQLMGGRLQIDSPQKGGTCLSCYWPRQAPQSRGRNGHQPNGATPKRS